MERRQGRAGLPSGLGAFHRSGQGSHTQFKKCFLSDSQYLHISFFLPLHQGRNVETVEVTEEFHTLSRLQADTEYIVTIIPLYEGINEGPGATARFKIGRCSQ